MMDHLCQEQQRQQLQQHTVMHFFHFLSGPHLHLASGEFCYLVTVGLWRFNVVINLLIFKVNQLILVTLKRHKPTVTK